MRLNLPKFFISFGSCFAVAILGSFITIPSISTWYLNLIKPAFSPPNWIFAPVWTMLYLLMAISVYLVWNKKFDRKTKKALRIFGVQLVLNLTWSLVFFGFHQPLLAFINIIALWFAIFITILKFYEISKTASILLIPYLAWVSFASFLNFGIVILNR